eukprot:TRINITY_DN10462_c0_g2_i1.p1 TRINITY_DN10462_c0_g2~~TRINITY_DN10462_c0_g2_i1.p1  ORF type:complete len:110 (+),score=23.93 TRINITY_DN10462_c0_g2_i1:119-448(+)
MARLLGAMLLLIAGQQVLAGCGASCRQAGYKQKAIKTAQKLGAEYLAKKRGEAAVLKKAPSLIQMSGLGAKPMVLKKVTPGVLAPQPSAPAKSASSFNPFKPDAALMMR